MATTVASTEFQNRAGLYLDQAAKAPVFITRHRRPVRVLIDIEEYERLKSRDREVLALGEFSAADRAAIAASRPPADTAAFDDELDT